MTRCRRTLKQTRFNCCVQTEFRGKRASKFATVCSFCLGLGCPSRCVPRVLHKQQETLQELAVAHRSPFSEKASAAPSRHRRVFPPSSGARAPRHGPRATAPEPRACRPISDVSIYPLTSPHPPPNPRGHDPLLHQSTATAHRESATDIRAPASLSLPTVPPQATRRSHAGGEGNGHGRDCHGGE